MKRERQQNDRTTAGGAGRRRARRVLVMCLLLCVVSGVVTVAWLLRRDRAAGSSDTDVPLGVEQAVVVRYSGPRLQARPYRRGASVNLRIANEVQKGRVRVYDIRYVISLPGDFDLTEYLTSTDGREIEDLPPFHVRGLTSLTKDIETRIQEIETVGVHFWHGYYETLVGLGALWVAWLVGLVIWGRPQRPPPPVVEPPPPSTAEKIECLFASMSRRELTVDEKARLEILLLRRWREQLELLEHRMVASCRHIQASREWGGIYGTLQDWLHNPRSVVDPDQFVRLYMQSSHGVGGEIS